MLTPSAAYARDKRKMPMDSATANAAAVNVQKPQVAAQANPAQPKQPQQAPMTPATKGAMPNIPTFQAPQRAPVPPPAQMPSQQPAPQGQAPGAQQGGGGLSQQNNVGGGVQFTPGQVSTPQPAATPRAQPAPVAAGRFDADSLYGTEGTWTLGNSGNSPYGGGGTFTPNPNQPGSEAPPIVFDDRTQEQMLEDFIKEQLMAGGIDTSEQERILAEQMARESGQSIADTRAGLAAGGYGTSGALAGISGDIRSQAAVREAEGVAGIRGDAQDRWLDQILGVSENLQSERELGITEDAYSFAKDYLKQVLGDDGGGGGGGGGMGGGGLADYQAAAHSAAAGALGMPGGAGGQTEYMGQGTPPPGDAALVRRFGPYVYWVGADGGNFYSFDPGNSIDVE